MAAETTTEEPQQEYGYIIDGEVYPEPENLVMRDHRIIKRYTGMNFREISELPGDWLYVDQDGICAIMHIAYRHHHPDLSFEEINEIIEQQNLEEAQKGMQLASDVPLDLASTTKPDESSPTRKPSTTEPSGTDSPKSSENLEESPATTGTSESATSFRQLAQVAAEESAS